MRLAFGQVVYYSHMFSFQLFHTEQLIFMRSTKQSSLDLWLPMERREGRHGTSNLMYRLVSQLVQSTPNPTKRLINVQDKTNLTLVQLELSHPIGLEHAKCESER